MPDYGTPTEYKEDLPLAFPDLTLVFLGLRHTPSPMFAPGFRRWEFHLADGGDEAALAWSNGTGVIAPKKFTFRQAGYYLELLSSVELGWLPGDHLVLWQAAPFEDCLRARGFLGAGK